MSIETEQFLRLKNKIYSDLNVTKFFINYWEKLKEIPQEIRLLQHLEHLSIYRNKSIKFYPPELADLPNLRHLFLQSNNLKQLPKVLGDMKQLETLSISKNRFLATTKWSLLTQMSNLRTLDLSYSLQNLSCLPEEIGHIKNLRVLNISGNRLSSLPNSLKQLKHLEELYCEMNDFEKFPHILTQLPQLKTLHISAKSLHDLPDSVLDLQQIPNLTFTAKSTKKTPYIYPFERLLKNNALHQFDPKVQLFYLSLIRKDQVIEELSNQQLLQVLNTAIPAYTNQALSELEQRILQHQFGDFRWPQKGDKIIIKGKLKGKVNDLKTRLQANGITTGIKINDQSAFLLVGSMPNAIYSAIEEHNMLLLTEQMLVAHLNRIEQPYLLSTEKEDAENLEHIRQLLHSKDSTNILLGLEILKGGGFPMELLTELFLIYKFSRVQKVKRTIVQIIGQYAPLEFVTALKNRKAIGSTLSEITRRRNLEYYCKLGPLDKKYIAFYLLQQGDYGRLFALFNLKTKDKITYFKKIMEDGFLSFSNLELDVLPDDFGAIEQLESLDISYNKFKEVPKVLFQCKQLKTIYIRGLEDIQKSPDDLWNIPNLRTIYVGYNNRWAGDFKHNNITINGKKIISR